MRYFFQVNFSKLRLMFLLILVVQFLILSVTVNAAKSNLVYINLGCITSETEDVSAVYFDEGPTENFDSEYDAYKFMPGPMYVCTLSNDERELSINGMPEVEYSSQVPLKVVSPYSGDHYFRFENIVSMEAHLSVFLVDYLLGEMMAVTEGTVYFFDLNTVFEGRFELVVSTNSSTDIVTSLVTGSKGESAVSLSPIPCGATFTVQFENLSYQGSMMTIYDQQGKVLMTEVLNDARTEITLPQSIMRGHYIVVISKDGRIESNNLIVASSQRNY